MILRTLRWLHLWLGLSAGLLFAIIGLSGSVLVFHGELLHAAHPALRVEPKIDGVVLARLFDEWGPRGMSAIDLPRESMGAYQAYFTDHTRRYFSPDDGALLLERHHSSDALLWLHELHTALLADEPGHEVVGVVGLVALFLLASGVYLWWPRFSPFAANLKWYRGPPMRRWLSWHRSLGVLTLPIVFLVTLTGVGMVYHEAARSLLTTLFGGHANATPPVHERSAPSTDWPNVLATAQQAIPGSELIRIGTPNDRTQVIAVRFRAPGEWHPNGRSMAWLDPAEGRLIAMHDARTQPAGARASEAIYPVHIGSFGGGRVGEDSAGEFAYRILVCIAGLVPTFLLVTGFLFWLRRPARVSAR